MGIKVVGNGTLTGAQSLKASQGKLVNLSKKLNPGTRYRLIFPRSLETGEIVTAIVPGRQCDFKKLKVSFIPLRDFEQEESGRIIDTTVLGKYARICRVLKEAAYNQECSRAKKEAQEQADNLYGGKIQESQLNTVLQEITLKYKGNSDVTPTIYPSEPDLLSGLKLLTATECVVIPLTSAGAPEWTQAWPASVDLTTGAKRNKLASIQNNAEFVDMNADFVEVDYDYAGATKEEAGRAASFAGVSKDMSLMTKDPAGWDANIDRIKGMLVYNQIAVAGRNMAMSSPVTVKEFLTRFSKYMSRNTGLWIHVNMEDEVTERAAKDILTEQLVDGMETLKMKFVELAARATNEGDDDVADGTSAAPEEFGKVKDSQLLSDLEKSSETLEGMLATEDAGEIAEPMGDL